MCRRIKYYQLKLSLVVAVVLFPIWFAFSSQMLWNRWKKSQHLILFVYASNHDLQLELTVDWARKAQTHTSPCMQIIFGCWSEHNYVYICVVYYILPFISLLCLQSTFSSIHLTYETIFFCIFYKIENVACLCVENCVSVKFPGIQRNPVAVAETRQKWK